MGHVKPHEATKLITCSQKGGPGGANTQLLQANLSNFYAKFR